MYPSLSEQFKGNTDLLNNAGQLPEAIRLTNESSHWPKQSPIHKGTAALVSASKIDAVYVDNTFRSRVEFCERTKLLMRDEWLLAAAYIMDDS